MEITSAKFVISNSRADKCPEGNLPEYAFIGRSNVGKSSLINMLTNHSKLAMTSSTPGKTLLINHFLINNAWYLVDLPGYGYAQRGKKVMEQIKNLIQHYVLERVLGVHRMARRKRHSFCTCIHQIRQAKCRKDQTKRRAFSRYAKRTMGRTSALFHHFRREKDGKRGSAGLH